MNKLEILARFIELQEAKLQQHHRAAGDAFKGATDSEVKSESKYDTRAIEASYLARGHALQIDGLTQELHALKNFQPALYQPGQAIGLGSLVVLNSATETYAYYLLPACGGIDTTAIYDKTPIEVTGLTLDAPIAQTLEGLTKGDKLAQPFNQAIVEVY